MDDNGEALPPGPRPTFQFADLRSSGLLWLINTSVLHPRGYALGLEINDETGEATGWTIYGDGTEAWRYGEEDGRSIYDIGFERVQEFFAVLNLTPDAYRGLTPDDQP